jgi:serine/threonine-protein kinase
MGAVPGPTEWLTPQPRYPDREERSDVARRLWERWQNGERPQVEEFLAEAGALDADEILAVLRVDQSERYRLGECVLAERYLQAFPALASDPERAIDLIFAEYLLREEMGTQPAAAGFLDRFPRYAEELKLQLELHQAMGTRNAQSAGAGIGAGAATVSRWNDFGRAARGDAREGLPRIPGYEILGILGRGGMGIVYRACRKELSRHVALKMVHAGGHASAAILARFRVEAEAVARLQHPNIVQIHDVGQFSGSPYLVLELIEGANLAQRIAGTPQMTEWSAELVETLARAIHAAHQQGVVHRDLTPANVLLTSDGSPKITDFGLAKLVVGGGELRTQTGELLGTPSYMAPEQAMSRHAAIGPATDIYALGAILYELLTGRPPFKAELPLETLRQVIADEPVAPSRLRPKLPKDLETICLKCLQKEPAQRYSDALALALDLRRFLDGRPILARPNGMVERSWRWCKRNRSVARLLALVIALLAIIAVGSTVAAVRLKRSRDEARRQHDIAELNFRDARQAVDDALTRVAESTLLHAPGLQPLRKQLLEDALKYYQGFLRRLGEQPGVQIELASALDRVAQITAEIGSKQQALDYRRKARGIYQALAADHPRERGLMRGLARSIAAVAQLRGEAGQRAEAVTDYQEALRIQHRLVQERPRDEDAWDDLAGSESGLGQVLNLLARPDESLRCFERAVAIRERTTAAEGELPARRNDRALDYSRIARLHHDAGREDEAIRRYRDAIALEEALVAAHPEVASYRSGLANTYTLLGISQRAVKRIGEALESYQKAQRAQEALVAANPSVTDYRYNLAATFNDIANLERATGRREHALATHERALEIRRALVGANPRVVRYQDSMAGSFNAIGINQADLGRLEAALETFRQLRAAMQIALAADPKNIDARYWLSTAWHNGGDVLVKLGRPAEAIPAFRQAIEQKRRVLAEGPQLKGRIRSLGNHYLDLAEAQRALGQPAAAAATLWEHRAIWDADAEGLCKLARGLALCIPLVLTGKSEPTAEQRAEELKYGDWAMNALRRAVALGVRDAGRIGADPDLRPIRGREDFRALSQEVAFPDDPFGHAGGMR